MIIHDDILNWAKEYKGPKFHGMLLDPPYHLTPQLNRFSKTNSKPPKEGVFRRQAKGFMQTTWDGGDLAFRPETWAALGEHLHPGGFGLAFASSRGFHRMMVAIEDAGFVLHPSIFMFGYCYLSGFPKATRIDTQIDKANGNVRPDKLNGGHIGMGVAAGDGDNENELHNRIPHVVGKGNHSNGTPVDPLAQTWAGHRYGGQALKPAIEPIISFSKPKFDISEQVFYNELETIIQDTSLLLEDLWTRLANNAETISRAESEVNTVLNNVLMLENKPGNHSIVNAVEKNLQDTPLQLKREPESTAQENVKTQLPESGLTAQTAENLRINAGLLSEHMPSNTTTVAQNVIQSTESTSEKETVSGAEKSSSVVEEAITNDIAQQNVDTSPKSAPTLKTPSEMATDTDITVAILQSISARAKLDLSTSWLWSITWDAVCERVSKSIISMDSRMITELRTFNYSLRSLMLNSRGIASEKSSSNQLWSYASDVNAHFIGLWTHLKEQLHSAPIAQKPSLEPIIMFQRPYSGRPVESIVKTGAGALWVDGSRIPTSQLDLEEMNRHKNPTRNGWAYNGSSDSTYEPNAGGRWPANLILTHSPRCDANGCAEDCGVRALDEQSGNNTNVGHYPKNGKIGATNVYGEFNGTGYDKDTYTDSGPASRMFHRADWQYEVAEQLANATPLRYHPKASSAEREAGLDGLETQIRHRVNAGGLENEPRFAPTQVKNIHPCVKPLSLTKYLAQLLLPPAEYAPRRILIPFCGVASEYIGAMLAGWEEVVGIEKQANYVEIARVRADWWRQWPGWGQTDPATILAATEAEPEQLAMFEEMK